MEPIQKKQRGGVAHPFPGRLHKLLQFSEIDPAISCTISWNEDGTSFRVHDKKAFEQEIQPTYSAQTKFASFHRQLNLWSFQRLSSKGLALKDHEEGYYAHPFFRRDEPNLCDQMKRSGATPSSSNKNNKKKTTSLSMKQENHSEPMLPDMTFKPVPTMQVQELLATGSSSSFSLTSSINTSKHHYAVDPVLMSHDRLGSSNGTNSAEEVTMKQLKAKEMYLRARLAEIKRLEDNMRIFQEQKNAFKETPQQRRVQEQSGTVSPIPLSDDDDDFLTSSIGNSNHILTRSELQENTSIVSIESMRQTQNTTTIVTTRQGEIYPRRRSSCNISKKDANLLLDLLEDD